MPKTHNLSEFSKFPTRPIHPFSFIKKLKKYSNSGAKKLTMSAAEHFFIIYKPGLYSSILKPLRGKFYEEIFSIMDRD
jgi:hypothetical protein